MTVPFTLRQDEVTYLLSDDLELKVNDKKPIDWNWMSISDKSVEYVYYVNGKVLTYMDCVVDNLLDDMKRMRVIWYYPKELSNEPSKLIQKLKFSE